DMVSKAFELMKIIKTTEASATQPTVRGASLGASQLTPAEREIVDQRKRDKFDSYFEQGKHFPYTEESLTKVITGKNINWDMSVRDRFVGANGNPTECLYTRCLLAYPDPESDVCRNLSLVQEDFKALPFAGKFYVTPAGAFHLTLKIMGKSQKESFSPAQVAEAKNAFATIAGRVEPFDVWVEGLTVEENSGRIMVQAFPLPRGGIPDPLGEIKQKDERSLMTILTPFQPLTSAEKEVLIRWVEANRSREFGRMHIKDAKFIYTKDGFALKSLLVSPVSFPLGKGPAAGKSLGEKYSNDIDMIEERILLGDGRYLNETNWQIVLESLARLRAVHHEPTALWAIEEFMKNGKFGTEENLGEIFKRFFGNQSLNQVFDFNGVRFWERVMYSFGRMKEKSPRAFTEKSLASILPFINNYYAQRVILERFVGREFKDGIRPEDFFDILNFFSDSGLKQEAFKILEKYMNQSGESISVKNLEKALLLLRSESWNEKLTALMMVQLYIASGVGGAERELRMKGFPFVEAKGAADRDIWSLYDRSEHDPVLRAFIDHTLIYDDDALVSRQIRQGLYSEDNFFTRNIFWLWIQFRVMKNNQIKTRILDDMTVAALRYTEGAETEIEIGSFYGFLTQVEEKDPEMAKIAQGHKVQLEKQYPHLLTGWRKWWKRILGGPRKVILKPEKLAKPGSQEAAPSVAMKQGFVGEEKGLFSYEISPEKKLPGKMMEVPARGASLGRGPEEETNALFPEGFWEDAKLRAEMFHEKMLPADQIKYELSKRGVAVSSDIESILSKIRFYQADEEEELKRFHLDVLAALLSRDPKSKKYRILDVLKKKGISLKSVESIAIQSISLVDQVDIGRGKGSMRDVARVMIHRKNKVVDFAAAVDKVYEEEPQEQVDLEDSASYIEFQTLKAAATSVKEMLPEPYLFAELGEKPNAIRVIFKEFVPGIDVEDWFEIFGRGALGVSTREVMYLLGRMFGEYYQRTGGWPKDMHFGNIIIRRDASGKIHLRMADYTGHDTSARKIALDFDNLISSHSPPSLRKLGISEDEISNHIYYLLKGFESTYARSEQAAAVIKSLEPELAILGQKHTRDILKNYAFTRDVIKIDPNWDRGVILPEVRGASLGERAGVSVMKSVAHGVAKKAAETEAAGPVETDGERAARMKRISERIAGEMMLKYGKIPDDNPAAGYVQSLFNEAMGAEAGDYRLIILPEMNEVNAIALPDGTVLIGRGLLEFVTFRDELAAVLAHEAMHIKRKHAEVQENLERITYTQNSIDFFLKSTGIARLQEYQADLGWMVEELNKRHINPLGQLVFFERLGERQKGRLGGGGKDLEHGALEDRALNTESIFYFLDLKTLSQELGEIPGSFRDDLKKIPKIGNIYLTTGTASFLERSERERIEEGRLRAAKKIPASQLAPALKSVYDNLKGEEDKFTRLYHKKVIARLAKRIDEALFPEAQWPDPKKRALARGLFYELAVGIPYLAVEANEDVKALKERQAVDNAQLQTAADFDMLSELAVSPEFQSIPSLFISQDPRKFTGKIFGQYLKLKNISKKPTKQTVTEAVSFAVGLSKNLESLFSSKAYRRIDAWEIFYLLIRQLDEAIPKRNAALRREVEKQSAASGPQPPLEKNTTPRISVKFMRISIER
ncbi:MAG: M48 family metalloprotease, partial [Candidatus Omnitrophica bacterium]|nr:M48 family metalloprotease [Candidatus Omnitrophota bacterium]